MLTIGLTGGIGAGKSTVTKYIASKGFKIIDADAIARELVLPGSDTLTALVDRFGPDILESDGTLNRKRLAGIVFSDQNRKRELDEIMHGKILEIIRFRIDQYKCMEPVVNSEGERNDTSTHVVFIDAALLFETGLDAFADEIWIVDADDETRIRRIIERDAINREDVVKRIASQMPRQDKLARADRILDNSGSLNDLYRQIDGLLEELSEIFRA